MIDVSLMSSKFLEHELNAKKERKEVALRSQKTVTVFFLKVSFPKKKKTRFPP